MAKVTFADTDIHPDVKVVKGLPNVETDKNKRQSEIQAIRNAILKVKGASLMQRNPDVFVARTAEAAKAVSEARPIVRQSRKAKYKAEDIFAS